MKTHKWLPHAVIRPGKHAAAVPRAWATRTILMTALVLTSLGAVIAGMAGHGQSGHATIRQPAVHAGLTVVIRPVNPAPAHRLQVPWMY